MIKLLGVIALLALIGCSGKSHDNGPVADQTGQTVQPDTPSTDPTPTPSPTPDPTPAPTPNDPNPTPNPTPTPGPTPTPAPAPQNPDVTQSETVKFHRLEQMTTRYDCYGHIVSRKLETLNSLSKKIVINYENKKNAWSYKVYNRQTKSSAGTRLMKTGEFVIDYAPTVFNMRVQQGINEVEYAFMKCPKIVTDPNGVRTCAKDPVPEKQGVVQIDVYYSSETVPGERFFKPTWTACHLRE